MQWLTVLLVCRWVPDGELGEFAVRNPQQHQQHVTAWQGPQTTEPDIEEVTWRLCREAFIGGTKHWL